MSIGMNHTAERESSAPEDNVVKQKTSRRHGACEPCRVAKIRCDGEHPCSGCRTEKRKSRSCFYSEKARNIDRARREARKQRESNSLSGDEERIKEEPSIPQVDEPPVGPAPGPSSNPSAPMHRKISLCAIVEEFIHVKPGSRAKETQNLLRVEEEWRKFQAILASPFVNIDALPREKVAQLDAWKMELQQILKQLNHGDLRGAWISIAALLRSFSSWETFTPHIGDGTLSDPFSPAPSQTFLQEKNAIYTELVELDCALGFFHGDQSFQHDFDKSRFSTEGDQDGHSEDTVELFTTIREVLKIEMTSEAGVWEFGRLLHRHERSQPSTSLQRMAMCIHDSDPAERQAAKLTSCLVFAVMHCRAANIASHYSHPDVIIPKARDEDSVDFIRDHRLDQAKGITTECNQVKKYAGNALAAFARLCEIDAENTAKSWIRLHSALIAAVLFGIHGLRERSANNNWGPVKNELTATWERFLRLKPFNPECPIFDHAVRILRGCDKQDVKLKKGQYSKRSKAPIRDEDSPFPSDESDGPQLHPLTTEVPNLKGKKRDAISASESASPSRHKRRKTVPENAAQPKATRAASRETLPNTIHVQRLSTQQTPSLRQSNADANMSYYDVANPQSGSEHILQQQPPQVTEAVYPVPYPYSFHPPLNPDEEYWRQEGYALQFVKDQNSMHYDLVPLNQQQQQYIDPATQFASSFPPYGTSLQSGNVAPTPQFEESAHPQQHTIPPGFHAVHDFGNPILHSHTDQIPPHEPESLQQILSSPSEATVQPWSSIPHTSSTDMGPTVYQPPLPHAGLIRRSSEPVWQVSGQYNFPSQGYPYPNPDIQVHQTSFYDSRQHYPALESINQNQHQYCHPYSENRVTTPS